MKKYFLLIAIIGLAYSSIAQGGRTRPRATPEQRAQRLTNWVDQTVKLSPDQKTKVYAINLKYINLMHETKDSVQNDRKALWKDIQAENQQKDAELKSVLTADQYTAYAAAKKQRIEDMRERRKAKR
ncbi:MAG: hypothetical protein JST37_05695 [Bacteroidetes bacterium]|nr:hypothetical protein [Bacteroidota bacterium]MBS1979662.1 hypothetical protein [Bacteroidota bacterium]